MPKLERKKKSLKNFHHILVRKDVLKNNFLCLLKIKNFIPFLKKVF